MPKTAFAVFALILVCSCRPDDNAIKVKGSDTEVNLAVMLVESFHDTNAARFISVSGGGSGLGIAALLNGTADVANSSRSMSKNELLLFQEKRIAIDSFAFALDAIAIVVSKSLPIDSMSASDLAKIFRGDYSNWNKLTNRSMPITIYGRQSNSGTHHYVKNKLGIEFSPLAKQMNGNAQIIEALKTDVSGIGYVGAGYVMEGNNTQVKVLTISTGTGRAVSPLDAEAIAAGRYFFQRPLFQYFKTAAYAKIKPLLDFEKSAKGKAIIQAAGYYPVPKHESL